jgi:2-amino-4-hydroxy-6-hydroxymethyldihydropteridine diphosphokinase
MIDAYLSLGGNIGDRRAMLDEAVARLADLPGTAVTARSSYYRTAPVGPVAQEWFLNIAVALRTGMDAADLESACRRIEAALGRDRTRDIPWGPRTVDIDLIAIAGDERGVHRELTRGYVIVPLAEVAPGLVIAGKTVAQRLAGADTAGVERLDWPVPSPRRSAC